jgi:hypothetical protein
MEPGAISPFAAWESFYVIVGSSAAVLIGLQFVVVVLSAELNTPRTESTTNVFSNPTMIHFCAVLLTAAVLSAPWQAVTIAALILAACGVAGLIYVVRVFLLARKQRTYQLVMEDWVWHTMLPFIAYAVMLAGALCFWQQLLLGEYLIAACMLLLLFSGIHNAWDAVTYIAAMRREGISDEED